MDVSADDTGSRGSNYGDIEPNRRPKKHERHDETNDQAPRTVVGRRRAQWGTCLRARRQRRSRPCSRIALACDVRCEWSLSFRAKRHLGPRRRSAVRHLDKETWRRRIQRHDPQQQPRTRVGPSTRLQLPDSAGRGCGTCTRMVTASGRTQPRPFDLRLGVSCAGKESSRDRNTRGCSSPRRRHRISARRPSRARQQHWSRPFQLSRKGGGPFTRPRQGGTDHHGYTVRLP
jgi:hypothetical protein